MLNIAQLKQDWINDDIMRLFSKSEIQPLFVFVGGSYLNKTYTENSDVDIVIITTNVPSYTKIPYAFYYKDKYRLHGWLVNKNFNIVAGMNESFSFGVLFDPLLTNDYLLWINPNYPDAFNKWKKDAILRAELMYFSLINKHQQTIQLILAEQKYRNFKFFYALIYYYHMRHKIPIDYDFIKRIKSRKWTTEDESRIIELIHSIWNDYIDHADEVNLSYLNYYTNKKTSS